MSSTLALRLSGSYLALDSTPIAAKLPTDSKYDFKGLFAGATVDWHPFATGFRLSGGGKYWDTTFHEASPSGKTLNGTYYLASDVGTVTTSIVNASKFAPYLGFGYDATLFNTVDQRFGFTLDVGAFYMGNPTVKISAENTVAGFNADSVAEADRIRNDIKGWYRFYPVLTLSGKFAF